jgi:hypothetical protein
MDGIKRKRTGCANKVSVCGDHDDAAKYKRRNEKQNCECNIKRCHLKCSYCYNKDIRTAFVDLGLYEWKNIIEQILKNLIFH